MREEELILLVRKIQQRRSEFQNVAVTKMFSGLITLPRYTSADNRIINSDM